MAFNNDGSEQLLESLIKMVGRANHKVDSLQKRIIQLEMIIKEQVMERGPNIDYSILPQVPSSSKTH